MNKDNFINGNHFAEVCDFIIDADRPFIDKRISQQNCIIFCKTDYIISLFDYLKQFTDKKYIVVIGMSDYYFTEQVLFRKPSNVLKVFTTMNTIDSSDIVSVPVGVENFYGKSKGGSIDVDKLTEECNNICGEKQLRVYLNCNINNNIVERSSCYGAVRKSKYCFEQPITNFSEYVQAVNKSLFVACPEGNGIDTHRLWETFYLKSFPIVKRHNIFKDCLDLPYVFIDSWEEVTDSFIEKKYEEFKNKQCNYEKIYMKYWSDLIRSYNYLLNR